jgi:phage tail-like protein
MDVRPGRVREAGIDPPSVRFFPGGYMPNRSTDHHINCNFRVEIEGVTAASFLAVEGVEIKTEVIHFADGDNPLMDRKMPGRTTCSNILLKRGVTASEELWKWYKKVTEGKVERKSGSIIVCGDDGQELYRYNFFEAWPCRWKSLVLNAAEARNLVEELELAVEKVEKG